MLFLEVFGAFLAVFVLLILGLFVKKIIVFHEEAKGKGFFYGLKKK
jgi:hypothetical protein